MDKSDLITLQEPQKPPEPPPEGSWAARLTDGEILLWSGAPKVRFHTTTHIIRWTLLALLGLGGPLFLLGYLQTIFQPGSFPVSDHTALFIIGILACLPAAALFYVATRHRLKKMRSAFYSLTNERAIIGYTWPLKSRTIFHLKNHKDGHGIYDGTWTNPHSIFFSKRTVGSGIWRYDSYNGFWFVQDAEQVRTILNTLLRTDHA